MNEATQRSDKRIAILEATMELVAEQGFDHTPTSQIAKKAGVGMGTIYRYFADKEELIHEVFKYVIHKQMLEELKRHKPDAPIREQYLQLCMGMVEFSVQHPREAKYIEQYFNSPYGLSHRREMMGEEEGRQGRRPLPDRLFEKAKAQQIVKDLPLLALGALTFGPLIGLIRDIHAGIMEYDADLVQKVAEACWDAVKR